MGIRLNISDLFDMAIQVEKDAQAFFKGAASFYASPQARQMLLDLATMEAEHEAIFGVLKDRIVSEGRGGAPAGSPDVPGVPLIAAGVFVNGIQGDLAKQFTGREKPHEIVRRAIQFEKDTIVFLVDLKAFLNDPADKAHVDTIIREELGHVVKLVGHLGQT
ncbi:MAG: ferritin family protein [Planctomycetota bacterium]|nr:ferritin family protein [Planctomycetota bacterium]